MSDNSLRYWSLTRFKYDRPIALTQVLGEMMRVSGPCRRGLGRRVTLAIVAFMAIASGLYSVIIFPFRADLPWVAGSRPKARSQ